MNHDYWRNNLLNHVVPENEGKLSAPVSLRIPEKLLARLDACAEETGNPRYEAILHLLRWALDAYEKEPAAKPKKSA